MRTRVLLLVFGVGVLGGKPAVHNTVQLMPKEGVVAGLQNDPHSIVRVDIYRRDGSRESLILLEEHQ